MAMTRADGGPQRQVRLVGVLLIFEAVGLLGLVVYNGVLRIVRGRVEIVMEVWGPFETIVVGGVFLTAAIMAAVAAVGFLFLRRKGWLLAAFAQTLALGTCLTLYTELEPRFVYPIMLYCIVMILYLNSRYVRAVFHSGREPGERLGGNA